MRQPDSPLPLERVSSESEEVLRKHRQQATTETFLFIIGGWEEKVEGEWGRDQGPGTSGQGPAARDQRPGTSGQRPGTDW
jgi:hypothetical protein